MADEELGKMKGGLLSRILLWSFLSVLLLAGLIFLASKVYLASPLPAERISRLLTSYLHQPFHLKGLHTDGGTL